jgi:hypothetical protein
MNLNSQGLAGFMLGYIKCILFSRHFKLGMNKWWSCLKLKQFEVGEKQNKRSFLGY